MDNGIGIGGESWHTCRVSSDYKQSVVQLSGRRRHCSRAFSGFQQNLEACSEGVLQRLDAADRRFSYFPTVLMRAVLVGPFGRLERSIQLRHKKSLPELWN